MEVLLGKSPQELKEIAVRLGLPAFAGKQLSRWLYVRRATDIAEMTDISKAGREALAANCRIGAAQPTATLTSKDGTEKYLFDVAATCDGRMGGIEAVLIPDGDRNTLCVSSQAGCRMGCKFCMTGRQGFHGNLTAAEILAQILYVDGIHPLSNVVFMGMGEPLDNWAEVRRAIDVLTAEWGLAWSPKRITLSTIGVLPRLREFLDETRCHLAVSLHNPFPTERVTLMPVEKAWALTEVVRLLKQYDFTGQRRVSFEYTMFAGWNDSPAHADALLRLLRGLECRVNLIRFHQIPDFPYTTSSEKVMTAFRDRLSEGGITCTIRASRGEDILAACGMLAGQKK
ncbi:MAG: 23S rRNA (adenine(2503)-C(2))-methyltransferase RlmN [Bacteroidales bacterium]|nr:23S rRNA (adenine(2503)-C(2))-methyltransferase RlmN [Bacteroidales bacterium]